MNEIVQQIHDKLDELIVNDPLSFPNGEDFNTLLQTFLQSLVNDGDITEWVVLPTSYEGYKITVFKDDLSEDVIRNPDGGKV